MADDGDSPNDPQKTANLARIRDNQRRSRARRKDYLADLESKYRNCEQVGVAASAEIQTAAKNVVEENRRLRGLLKAYGIPDAEIDGVSGQQGPVAADTLEAMVNSRRPCGPGGECQSATQTVTSSRQVQPALSTQGQTQPTLPPNIVPRPIQQGAQFNGSTQPYMGQIPSPVSLTGAENPLSSAPTPPMAIGAIHHPALELPSGEHFAFSDGFHGQVMSQNAPQSHPQNEGLSSCQIAAENIRIFSPEAGYELEKQLGCRIPGQDCAVPNLKIFSVLDSYTGGSC